MARLFALLKVLIRCFHPSKILLSAAVGAGAFDASVAVDGAGTVECLTPIYDGVPDIDVMYNGHFSVGPYVIPNKYVAYAFPYTGGALIQWCVGTFAKKEKELSEKQGISVNKYLERQYGKEEPSGLLVLPHFAGAATPYMDLLSEKRPTKVKCIVVNEEFGHFSPAGNC